MIKMNYYVQNFTPQVGANSVSYSLVLRKNEDMFHMNVSADVNEGSVTSLSTSGEFKVCLSQRNSTNVTYKCEFENKLLYHEFHHGGSYNIHVLIKADVESIFVFVDEIVPPYTVSILWQLPQYFLLTAGEILFSLTNVQFTYTQVSPMTTT